MNITNKLFSLLGFAEPIELKRFNGINLLPQKLLLVSTASQPCSEIQQSLAHLKVTPYSQNNKLVEKSIDGMVIDATTYHCEDSYQALYQNVHDSLKYLTTNARIVVIARTAGQTQSQTQSHEQQAFNQGLVGFTKSLAKEVGRKGSTANIIFLNERTSAEKMRDEITGPLEFLLSAKSTFISGQVIKLNSQIDYTENKNIAEQKKIAVVTGAAQGIGAAIASKLSAYGYYVIGVDIEPVCDLLASTMTSLGGKHFILDVSDESAGEQLAEFLETYNGIDLMVHNAGITRDKTFAKMPEHWWLQTININLLSVMRINKLLIAKSRINAGGRIVCLSSISGIAGQGGQTNYACSKAGIIGYVNSIANEFSKCDITINAVAPGFIETQMTEQIPFFTREIGRRMNALGQGGLPVDVAETVAFFAEQSSYAISGQTIRVCGLNMMGK